MAEIRASQEGHVAAFAFPFTSHPIALFNLVCKLARAAPAIQFSFFNIERSNRALLSAGNVGIPSNFKSYNMSDGVPEGHRSSSEFQFQFEEFEMFVATLPGNFKRGLDVAVGERGRKISFLLTDALFSYCIGKLGFELDVPWISFWVIAPCLLSVFINIDEEGYMAKVFTPETNHEAMQLIKSRFRNVGSMLPKATAVVVNSYQEICPTLFTSDSISKVKNLLFAGCLTLPPSISLPPQPISSEEDKTGCAEWLDCQKPASVAYVCFGTAVRLPDSELLALAEGIEASGVRFLWVLKDDLIQVLPDGFLDRTRMQGKMVPWAPQIRVLAHPSVGVHVTHCGYNSVCESILCGVPMIGRPFWADNHVNAKMVEQELRIGTIVEGNVITKNEILKSLKTVFELQEGERMRESVNVLKQVLVKASGPDGRAAKDLKALVAIISK